MNCSDEQKDPPRRTGKRGEETRAALVRAAAALIADLGWGRVTTRAVAERAGLPLGTVSYHFAGKEELLTEAALNTVEEMFPISELEALGRLEDLTALVRAWVGEGRETMDPVGTGVLMEAMRESEWNPVLRRRLATLLADYRRVVAGLVAAEQTRGAAPSDPSPSGLATLISAAGDGLMLHAILDPELDVVEATEALLALLSREAGSGRRRDDERA